jgi:hypothetical protein
MEQYGQMNYYCIFSCIVLLISNNYIIYLYYKCIFFHLNFFFYKMMQYNIILFHFEWKWHYTLHIILPTYTQIGYIVMYMIIWCEVICIQ